MGEIGEESMKHVCRFCNKSFSCGRSLGGHMRSHVINSTDQYHDHQVKKKSCEGVLDKLCKECGKGFQSWKALFGHMKCHSLKNKKIASLNQDSWISHLDNKKSDAKNGPMKRSRSSLVSEIEQEQEAEVAMSLMMLSRDHMGSRCSKSSVLVNLRKVEGKDFIKKGCKMNKSEKTEVGFDFLERSEVGLIKINDIGLGFGGLKDSNKRKFECVTCDKSFHSHQALCGHKASHQKVLKRDFDLKIQSENKIEHEAVLDHDQESSSFNLDVGSLKKKKTVVLRAHTCPICFKVFTSGQALGGHKRSHFNQENNTNVINKPDEPVPEARGFLDLNMLPKEEEEEEEEEEEMNMSSSTTEYKSYCWEDSSDHHSQQSRILSLLSTS